MEQNLLNFNLSNWVGALLSGIPALLNIAIFTYTLIKLPKRNISYLFSIFVFTLVTWQLCDTFTRLSASYSTAEEWTKIMYLFALIITPVGLHFALLFTGKEKLAKSFPFLFLLYLPAIAIVALFCIGRNETDLYYRPLFGWVLAARVGKAVIFESVWIALLGIIMFCILFAYAIQVRNNKQRNRQALLLAIGFAIPTLQGTVTQVLFPDFLGLPEIPITSTFMTTFSVAALIALTKYKLFYFSPVTAANKVIATIADILIIVSPRHRIEFINPAGKGLLGIRGSEADSLKLDDLIYDKAWPDVLKKVTEGFRNKATTTEFFTTLLSKTRKKISVVVSIAPLIEAGSVEAILILAHDITDNKRSEERLRLTQYAVDNAQEAIFWLNPDDSFFYVNDAACDLLGYARYELLNMSVYDIAVQGIPKSSWVKSWQEVAGKHNMNITAKITKKDGNEILVELTADYLEYENFSFKIVHATNISEKIAQAEEITKQKELYESLVDAQSDMGEGVCVTEENKIIYANDALCRIYGYSREELYKLNSYSDLVPEEESKILNERFKQRIAGRISEPMATKVKCKDGSIIDIEYSVKILRAEEKLRMISIIRNKTRKSEKD